MRCVRGCALYLWARSLCGEAEELAGEGQSLWTARVNPKTQAKVGRSIDLAVDTGGFHFFDKDTGLAIGRLTEGEGAPRTTRSEDQTGVTRGRSTTAQSIPTAPERLPSSRRARRWGEAETEWRHRTTGH